MTINKCISPLSLFSIFFMSFLLHLLWIHVSMYVAKAPNTTTVLEGMNVMAFYDCLFQLDEHVHIYDPQNSNLNTRTCNDRTTGALYIILRSCFLLMIFVYFLLVFYITVIMTVVVIYCQFFSLLPLTSSIYRAYTYVVTIIFSANWEYSGTFKFNFKPGFHESSDFRYSQKLLCINFKNNQTKKSDKAKTKSCLRFVHSLFTCILDSLYEMGGCTGQDQI